MMRNKLLILFTMLALLPAQDAVAQNDPRNDLRNDPQRAFEQLLAADEPDPEAWRSLAIAAREKGVHELAARAIDRAESLGLAPVRATFERSRQAVARGDTDTALELLESMVAGGFTAVWFITGDPVLSTLAGQPRYDKLVADLSKQAWPCRYDDRLRAFDFWIGEWDVHLANGTLAGNNRISSEEQGCVLVEVWQSASGGSGRSINYFDAVTGEWVQVWQGAGGSQIEMRGGMTEEGMLLTGQIHYLATGVTAPFRGLWTPLPDGRVRQYFEQSNDGGETWTAWFEGFYTRKATSGSTP